MKVILAKRVVGLASVALGLFLLLVGIPMHVTSNGGLIGNPALFPLLAAWLLIGLGALQVIVGGPAPALPALGEPVRFALFAAVTVAATLLLTRIGYLATAIGLMAIVTLLIYERRPIWIAVTVLAVPVGIWLFFEHLLERPLP